MIQTDRLRVAVATPLSEDLCVLIETQEPRIELVRDQALLPPMRWNADFDGDPNFTRTPSEQKRFEALIDSADALYGIPDVSPAALARTIAANPRLRWVQIMAAGGGAQVKSAGLSSEDFERVVFTTSAGVHGGPLAEFALFGLLAGAKHLPRLMEQKANKTWSGRWPMAQLSEQTVLVVGLGGIGREVARKVSALGARVIAMSRNQAPVEGVAEFVSQAELAEAVKRVDAIVVTLPGTEATYKLIGPEVLKNVKHGTTLASVGRGTVIDEDALVAALQDGRIGFAALDVFAVEPLPQESTLWDMPNVIISPHSAANNAVEERLIAELFIDNAARLLDGDKLRNAVNTIEFY